MLYELFTNNKLGELTVNVQKQKVYYDGTQLTPSFLLTGTNIVCGEWITSTETLPTELLSLLNCSKGYVAYRFVIANMEVYVEENITLVNHNGKQVFEHIPPKLIRSMLGKNGIVDKDTVFTKLLMYINRPFGEEVIAAEYGEKIKLGEITVEQYIALLDTKAIDQTYRAKLGYMIAEKDSLVNNDRQWDSETMYIEPKYDITNLTLDEGIYHIKSKLGSKTEQNPIYTIDKENNTITYVVSVLTKDNENTIVNTPYY